MSKAADLLHHLWALLSGVSVRTKIMGIVLGLVRVLGLTVTLQVRATMQSTLTHELEDRGAAIAGELAARSTDLVLTNNLFALRELLQDSLIFHEEVRYGFIVDSGDRLLAHSFDGGFPPDLLAANTVYQDERYHLEILDTEEGLLWDFAAPIFQGRAGTMRVGLSEVRMRETVASTTRQLLMATALASVGGIIGAFFLAWVLTRPVTSLVGATKAVGKGQLDVQSPPWFDDEIGQLSTAFNQMVSDLAKARQETEARNELLLRRNRALAAINTVARAVSGPLTLEEVLERALEKVLEVTGLQAGWTCLLNDQGRCARLSTCVGLAPETTCLVVDECLVGCATGRILQDRKPMVVPISASCPLAEIQLEGQSPACHVTIPLVVRSKVVGVLNITSAKPEQFGAEDLDLLNAIGHQLGLAVENARLLEEVQRKEAMRGQLLGKVISAQEAERKRIARELHDETGQALTSILVGLRTLDSAQDMPRFKHGLNELKGVVTKTLEGVHSMAVELRPSILDDLGLVPALQRYAKEYSARHGVAAEFQAVGLDGRRFSPQVEISLYRIVQEAMTNAVRHASACHVSVLLERRRDQAVVIVEDDGEGFDVEQVLGADMRHRLGLYGMEERATLVGGRLSIESTPGSGTTVYVEAPL
ncbi:MAG: GAF domain-containing protein [Anaerolineales bacterium]|nr:GAF domain-containing protein [Anaerolineales bacterium]